MSLQYKLLIALVALSVSGVLGALVSTNQAVSDAARARPPHLLL